MSMDRGHASWVVWKDRLRVREPDLWVLPDSLTEAWLICCSAEHNLFVEAILFCAVCQIGCLLPFPLARPLLDPGWWFSCMAYDLTAEFTSTWEP